MESSLEGYEVTFAELMITDDLYQYRAHVVSSQDASVLSQGVNAHQVVHTVISGIFGHAWCLMGLFLSSG